MKSCYESHSISSLYLSVFIPRGAAPTGALRIQQQSFVMLDHTCAVFNRCLSFVHSSELYTAVVWARFACLEAVYKYYHCLQGIAVLYPVLLPDNGAAEFNCCREVVSSVE